MLVKTPLRQTLIPVCLFYERDWFYYTASVICFGIKKKLFLVELNKNIVDLYGINDVMIIIYNEICFLPIPPLLFLTIILLHSLSFKPPIQKRNDAIR